MIVWCGTSDRHAPPDKVRPPRPLIDGRLRVLKFETEDEATKYLVEMVFSDSHEPEFVEELRVMLSAKAEELGSDLS